MARNGLLGAVGGVAALVAIAAVVGWFFFIRGDDPPPVSLESAIQALATVTATTAPATAATAATAATTAPVPNAADPSSLVGDWRISEGAESVVGYRIVEELARFGTNTAVGRTSDVIGTLRYDGSAITAVAIEAELSTLKSDDSRRDNAVRGRALETSTFPTATFTLTEPIALDLQPADDVTIAVSAQGELTLHGVTREVAIPIEGKLAGGRVIVVGSLDILLADYEISPPRAPLVLSIEDHAVIEFQLVFERG